MKSRKIISLVIVMSMLMACIVVVNVPVVSAAPRPDEITSTKYYDTFEHYGGNFGYKATLQGLDQYCGGWYAANHTQITPLANASAYSAVNYKLVELTTVDDTHCLHITSPVDKNNNTTMPDYGYAKVFPGVTTNGTATGAATGYWEITFDFKPVLNANNKTQFAFTLNTGDGTAANDTAAQHNIIAGYGTNLYLGYRNYETIKNNNVTQGTLAAGSSLSRWYTVKTYLNCDAHYYSVELYNKATGKLIARRSPISFAGNENIGFLKFSALGINNEQHDVYVDNITIEQKATADKTIYNETFNSFTAGSTYSASVGMTTGSATEVVTGDSYFEGFTPWRYNTNIGKAYAIDTIDGRKAVQLGNTGGSGLVYMQVGESLVTSSTQPSRGLFETSFKFKPVAIDDDVTVNVIPSVSTNIANNNVCAVFKIFNDNGTPYLQTTNGYQDQPLSNDSWYQVKLFFDVENQQLTTRITDTTNTSFTFAKTVSGMSAVKAIMFNVPGTSNVYMDDIKLEYCSASAVPNPSPTAAPTAAPTEAPTAAPVAPTVSMTAKASASQTVTDAFYYVINIVLNDGIANTFVVKHFPANRDEDVARVQNFTVNNISDAVLKLISVLKDIPEGQEDRDITTKATLTYTLGGNSASVGAENTTSLSAAK